MMRLRGFRLWYDDEPCSALLSHEWEWSDNRVKLEGFHGRSQESNPLHDGGLRGWKVLNGL